MVNMTNFDRSITELKMHGKHDLRMFKALSGENILLIGNEKKLAGYLTNV